MIAINVSKGSAMLFAKTGKHNPNPRTDHLFGEPIQRVDNVPYLGVTLDKRLTWSTYIDQVRKKKAQRRSSLSIRNGVLLYKQLFRPMMDYTCPVWRSPARSHIKTCRCCRPSVFALLPMHLGTLVTGKFRII
jgi:hypothetical protein